jgi:hypothetical protein
MRTTFDDGARSIHAGERIDGRSGLERARRVRSLVTGWSLQRSGAAAPASGAQWRRPTLTPRGEHVKKQSGSKSSGGATVIAFGNTWAGCKPATSEQIASLEQVFGAPLPRSVASVFRTIGGGRPAKNFFTALAPPDQVAVGRVLPLEREGKAPCAIDVLRGQHGVHGLARKLVPFALDTGNANYFCLDPEDGRVLYWVPGDKQSPFRTMASNVSMFLAGLRASPT